MAFESGSLSFSMCYLPSRLPEDCLSGFADYALPPLSTLSEEPISGWVTGRHLLDNKIEADTSYYGGRLRLALVKAERKVPAALLLAECKMEQLAVMAAEGKPFLDRRTKSEIKKSVTKRLLPKMPPILTGVPIIYERSGEVLYAGATTEKQMDALTFSLRQATGETAIPVTPETAAIQRLQIDVRDLRPTSFSPAIEDALAEDSIGMDFLTWLWFFFDQAGGTFQDGDYPCGVMIEGPLHFYMEGRGAHVAVLRQGEPLVSPEAFAALRAGKKLKQAKVTLVRGEDTWSGIVDATRFIVRSLKLPKSEVYDAIGRFEDRMIKLDLFRELFLGLYDRFLVQRTDRSNWEKTKKSMQDWVTGSCI